MTLKVSFIYLTLRSDATTQMWNRDYITFPRSVVFLIMLEPGAGSTQWRTPRGTHVSNAVTGDIVPFDPVCEHRGVATGEQRFAMYVSLRSTTSTRAESTAHKAKHTGLRTTATFEKAATFEEADYNDCNRPREGGR